MWIKRQVVMLPTNEKAEIGNFIISKYDHNNHLVCGVKKQESFNMSETRQHLYITSDEQIKEGDWFIRDNKLYNEFKTSLTPNVTIFIRLYPNLDLSEQWREVYISDCKKIIATTDESLSSKCNNNCTNYITESCNSLCYKSFPQPSTQFINKYVEEYNKGNIITEVMVEYYDDLYIRNKLQARGKLKINPKDNTISIRKIKDSWNREEVKDLLLNLSSFKGDQNDYEEVNKWIEKNL